MISFEISEEEKLIAETSESFARVLRDNMRKWEKEGLSQDIVSKHRELGFTFIDVPEELGGHNLGFFSKVLSLQKLSAGCASATLFLELPAISLHLIANGNMSESQKVKYKEEILQNPLGIYIDFDESFSVSASETISGKASCVLGKDIKKFALVRKENVYIFDDFEIIPKKPLALDAVGVNEIILNSKKACDSFKLKDEGKLFISILRLYLSAILCGILRASFEYASKYAMEREAFGKKIAHHQGLTFILSDFSIATSASELYTWQGAWAIDTHQENFFHTIADIFSFVSENSEKFTVWGVQILGGHGFVKDHPVEKWMREAKAISLLFGGKHQTNIDSFFPPS